MICSGNRIGCNLIVKQSVMFDLVIFMGAIVIAIAIWYLGLAMIRLAYAGKAKL